MFRQLAQGLIPFIGDLSRTDDSKIPAETVGFNGHKSAQNMVDCSSLRFTRKLTIGLGPFQSSNDSLGSWTTTMAANSSRFVDVAVTTEHQIVRNGDEYDHRGTPLVIPFSVENNIVFVKREDGRELSVYDSVNKFCREHGQVYGPSCARQVLMATHRANIDQIGAAQILTRKHGPDPAKVDFLIDSSSPESWS